MIPWQKRRPTKKNEKQPLPANGFMHEPANLKLQSQVTASRAKQEIVFSLLLLHHAGEKSIAVARISPYRPGRCA